MILNLVEYEVGIKLRLLKVSKTLKIAQHPDETFLLLPFSNLDQSCSPTSSFMGLMGPGMVVYSSKSILKSFTPITQISNHQSPPL